jgi:hypothetical protein
MPSRGNRCPSGLLAGVHSIDPCCSPACLRCVLLQAPDCHWQPPAGLRCWQHHIAGTGGRGWPTCKGEQKRCFAERNAPVAPSHHNECNSCNARQGHTSAAAEAILSAVAAPEAAAPPCIASFKSNNVMHQYRCYCCCCYRPPLRCPLLPWRRLEASPLFPGSVQSAATCSTSHLNRDTAACILSRGCLSTTPLPLHAACCAECWLSS